MDGSDTSWQQSVILTKYGVADRDDFFVGSKIIVFGRHLTICSCPFEICREIEGRGDKLREKQAWLQSKIESVLAVPVVPRKELDYSRMKMRHTHTGKSNLRQLVRENNRLTEQLCNLGLSHLVSSSR